jgi:choice-of-anchor B domain-containing protein
MSHKVRLVQASLIVVLGAVASVSLAHDGDPKGRVAHPTYTGPGWCLGGGGCFGSDEGGIAGAPEFPSSNVQLLAWLPVNQFGAQNTTGNTVEGYVSPTGREYAIIGLSDGTGFVDVTDPGSPVIVDFVPGVESLWHDVRVYENYCYNVSEGGTGIQIMNMANIDSGDVVAVGNITADGPIPTTATHTVFINQESGYLYRAGGGQNGLRIYNLEPNPASPTYVTAWTTRYVHEVTVVNYTSGPYAGKEIAFACGGSSGGSTQTGLYILDVTNKQNIVQMAFYQYPMNRFCHQGWLSEDKHYFYIDDELDDSFHGILATTHIIDVSNLSAPFQAGTFSSGAGGIDHNLYVKDNFIYEANYRTGLRVFDATNPIAPVEVAYFDTWPTDNNASFNGLWDNYPFLPSGIVLGADIERGLFVWRVGASLLAFEYPNGQPELIDPAGDSVAVNINNVDGEVDPATARLNYSIDGGAFVQTPLEHAGGPAFNAVFPSMPCQSQVRWYISVQTTTGTTVRDPAGAPSSFYEGLAVANLTVGVSDQMETNTGWVVGAAGDNATSGIWVRADPVGTAAQPEDDHTPAPGVNCFITANGTPGGAAGAADIDNGVTTLTSPALDATADSDPQLVYHRWYSNNTGSAPGLDSMPVQISNNNGATWVQLELVTENAGAWVKKTFRIANFLPPTNQMKVRFIARDLDAGSVVEAGVDDLRIEYVECKPTTIPGDVNGDGSVDADDLVAVILAWGPCPAPPAACPADIDENGQVDADDLVLVVLNWS